MRYPSDRKAQTRKTILEAAGRVFKRRGYHAGGVDAVMKEAGLTHGGFYAHFPNKEALLAETVIESMREAQGRHQAWGDGLSGSEWIRTFLTGYLSSGHLEHVEHGCPAPALVSELDRVGEKPQASFEKGLRFWARDIASQLEGQPEPQREEIALAMIASCVGSVALARAVPDSDFRLKILDSSRELLLRTLGLDTAGDSGRADLEPSTAAKDPAEKETTPAVEATS